MIASGFVMRDPSDNGASKEPVTQLRAGIHQFLWLCSFGMSRVRIKDPRSLGLCCIKGSDDESLTRVDSSVPLMHRDLGSLIYLDWIKGSWEIRLSSTFFTNFSPHQWGFPPMKDATAHKNTTFYYQLLLQDYPSLNIFLLNRLDTFKLALLLCTCFQSSRKEDVRRVTTTGAKYT